MFKSRFKSPQHPDKFTKFAQNISGIKWSNPDEIKQSFSVLAEEIEKITFYEIEYYYNKRNIRSWISTAFRLLGLCLGAFGVLAPTVATAFSKPSAEIAAQGLAGVALAGVCFAADALFGGTSGHIRAVTAQLALERTLALYRIQRCAAETKLGMQNCDPDSVNSAFKVLTVYMTETFATTTDETAAWGNNLIAELNRYRESLPKVQIPGSADASEKKT